MSELSLLFEISKGLDSSLDLRDVVGPVLDAVAKHMGVLRGTLTLLNKGKNEITTEAAYGLSRKEQERGRYKVGEGITGKVFEEGKPAVVKHVSEEPLFLNRTRSRKESGKKDISFICVPIKVGRKVIGALSVDKLFSKEILFDEDVRLLTIVASMIAQAVRLRQIAEEDKKKLVEENIELHEKLKNKYRPSNVIGNSKKMQAVYDMIAQVSKSNATVLIRGESGTGKELIANAIHYNSHRANKPFIKVSCAALPETVIESELFGHEKGAFTGAVSLRKGRFEIASGGTIFLDEIGDLSPAIQIKLLRVLQEREFERIGGTNTIKTDVRIITATNRDLEDFVSKKKFREDLYYRLNVFPIHLPSLKDRGPDILLLADYFVAKYSKENSKKVRRISTPAIDMMMAYHWPGNVRELENCIERAVLLSSDEVIHGHHLPPTLQTAEASGTKFTGTLDSTLRDVEKELINDALKSSRGNKAKAAKMLGISERIMGLRVAQHKIDYRRFRTYS